MNNFFVGKTAIFSRKVPSNILLEWRTNGGRFFYEIPRNKYEAPDYYFTAPSHTNFFHPEGTIVLNTNWILDSLDAQTFLPCKYYTVIGVSPPRLTWSTMFSELSNADPLSSLKWLLGGFLTTPSRTSPEKQAEDENSEPSRKRQLSMAVDEMETALLRLREVAAKAPVSVAEQCQETVYHDTKGGWDCDEDWTDISDESENKVMEYYKEIKNEEQKVDKEPDAEGKDGMVTCEHDKLDCSSVGWPFLNKVTSESSFDEYCTEGTGDEDMEELEYSRTPESDEGNEVAKIEYRGMNDQTGQSGIIEDMNEFEDEFKYAPSSEIPETCEIKDLDKKSYQSTPDIGVEPANMESSFSSFEDNISSSPFYQSGSSADDFSSVSPSFYVAYREIKSPKSPSPRLPSKTALTSTNEVSTDRSNSRRISTPTKEESPNYPLLLNTPIGPRFAAELFPQNITPRSPARQARLESQQRVKRLLRDYKFASTMDDEIYLPNLKHTMSEEPITMTARPSERGTKVWDVRAVEMDEKMVRLIRVGEGICV